MFLLPGEPLSCTRRLRWFTSNISVSQDVPDKATQFFQHALRVAPDHTKSRLAMKVGTHHFTASWHIIPIYHPFLLSLFSLSSSPPPPPLLSFPPLLYSSSSPSCPSPPLSSFRNQSHSKLKKMKVTERFEVGTITGHMTFTQKLSKLTLSTTSPMPSSTATEHL